MRTEIARQSVDSPFIFERLCCEYLKWYSGAPSSSDISSSFSVVELGLDELQEAGVGAEELLLLAVDRFGVARLDELDVVALAGVLLLLKLVVFGVLPGAWAMP